MRFHAVFVSLGLVPLWGCAGAGSAVEAGPVETRLFDLHSDLGLNLHHFLHRWARAEFPPDGRPPPPIPERERLEELPEIERIAWNEAVSLYRDAAGKDLLFNGDMVALKRRLVESPGLPEVAYDDPLFAYVAALRTAEDVYRRRFWPEHDAQNRRWIAEVAPRLEQHEEELAQALAAAYGGTWPTEIVRVDASYYANWAGAYTSGEPPHAVISTSDRDNQGLYALETVMHETSHAGPLEGAVRSSLDEAFRAKGAQPPRDLWHVMIFYTASDAVRRTAGAKGLEPYGERTGLYDRVTGWRSTVRTLEASWQPYLDGAVDRKTALEGVAAAISSGRE